MTDWTLATAAVPTRPHRIDQDRPARPARPDPPGGVPWWVRLLGVAVIPLQDPADTADAAAPRTWVLSAGGGTMNVAALLVDDSTDH